MCVRVWEEGRGAGGEPKERGETPVFFKPRARKNAHQTLTLPPHTPPPLQFGVPLYGATLSGEVQYVGGDAEGCTPFSERVRPSTPGFPVVLLVDRGDCYFIEKAYNAEKAGAQVREREGGWEKGGQHDPKQKQSKLNHTHPTLRPSSWPTLKTRSC